MYTYSVSVHVLFLTLEQRGGGCKFANLQPPSVFPEYFRDPEEFSDAPWSILRGNPCGHMGEKSLKIFQPVSA